MKPTHEVRATITRTRGQLTETVAVAEPLGKIIKGTNP